MNRRFMADQYLINRFRGARTDPSLVVLEGFHPLKHALRFGAEILEAVAVDAGVVEQLGASLAPDIAPQLQEIVASIPAEVFAELAPVPAPTGVIALAQRPRISASDVMQTAGSDPVILLERPRNPFNIGAAVRVAAAAGAGGFVSTGAQDPWHPSAVLSGVGLQFALPVARSDSLPRCDRALLAVDPVGEALRPETIPPGCVLAFGNERDGISDELAAAAQGRVSIPMVAGVSSLNLATAVAVVMYTWRLNHPA